MSLFLLVCTHDEARLNFNLPPAGFFPSSLCVCVVCWSLKLPFISQNIQTSPIHLNRKGNQNNTMARSRGVILAATAILAAQSVSGWTYSAVEIGDLFGLASFCNRVDPLAFKRRKEEGKRKQAFLSLISSPGLKRLKS